MAGDEYLKRIDAHMERMDAQIERIDAHMERGNELMQRGNELMARNESAFNDLRTFLREMTLRQERIFDGFIQQLDRMGRALEDMTAEQRAQRTALFRMLDRLDEGGSAAGA